MSILETSQDGAFVFVALEDDATGDQIIFKITRPTSTTPTTEIAYEPLGGSAGNVARSADYDAMIWHGNFGTDIGVVIYSIVLETNTDISPSSIGAKLIQPLSADPHDRSHFVAINQDDQDALETDDTGANWATLNAALGLTVEAMDLVFLGAYFPFGGFIGGNDGVDENLSYTPNEFNNLRDDASAALKAVGAIVSVDVALE
jgi:hypothetical protein